MKNLQQAFSIRAVRMGLLALVLGVFVGLPSIDEYTGKDTFQKLDVVDYTVAIFLATDIQSASNNSGMQAQPGEKEADR